MRNFKVPPMSRIRVGVVGVGSRGFGAVKRLAKVPGVELTAICDTRKDFLDVAIEEAKKLTGRALRAFGPGDEAYKGLCDCGEVDVVYNTTAWEWHVPIALFCGHTHYAEIDDFSETAKMYVVGGNYEGRAYEITFT